MKKYFRVLYDHSRGTDSAIIEVEYSNDFRTMSNNIYLALDKVAKERNHKICCLNSITDLGVPFWTHYCNYLPLSLLFAENH